MFGRWRTKISTAMNRLTAIRSVRPSPQAKTGDSAAASWAASPAASVERAQGPSMPPTGMVMLLVALARSMAAALRSKARWSMTAPP